MAEYSRSRKPFHQKDIGKIDWSDPSYEIRSWKMVHSCSIRARYRHAETNMKSEMQDLRWFGNLRVGPSGETVKWNGIGQQQSGGDVDRESLAARVEVRNLLYSAHGRSRERRASECGTAQERRRPRGPCKCPACPGPGEFQVSLGRLANLCPLGHHRLRYHCYPGRRSARLLSSCCSVRRRISRIMAR